MTYEELSKGIIECVGGTQNIASAINCMTRVRIRVNRDDAVRDDDLRALDGVLSIIHNQQRIRHRIRGDCSDDRKKAAHRVREGEQG